MGQHRSLRISSGLAGGILLASSIASGQGAAPYLSNLSAVPSSPLFTTYAAPLARSGFVVDEGYQFSWFDPGKPVRFETDNGGSVGVAFRKGNDVRFFSGENATPVAVTTSYSDIVRFNYSPFPDIRADGIFDVYSSRLAILDLTVSNHGASAVDLSVFPLFDHSGSQVTSVAPLPERDGFVFAHRESLDGWTIDHGIPYESDLLDVLLLDTVAAAYGAYSSLGQRISGPWTARLADNYCVEWGLLYHPDGTLCKHLPPAVRQCVVRKSNAAELLTEDAPKWGDPDPNIPGNGYQGCELGHFVEPPLAAGDTFRVVVTCSATGSRGEATGIVPLLSGSTGVHIDVHCLALQSPPTPTHVACALSADSTAAALSWDVLPGFRYHVYRRTMSTPGHYWRKGTDPPGGTWSDYGLKRDTTYGYVVLAEDSAGHLSGHSDEVRTTTGGTRDFFSDVQQNGL